MVDVRCASFSVRGLASLLFAAVFCTAAAAGASGKTLEPATTVAEDTAGVTSSSDEPWQSRAVASSAAVAGGAGGVVVAAAATAVAFAVNPLLAVVPLLGVPLAAIAGVTMTSGAFTDSEGQLIVAGVSSASAVAGGLVGALLGAFLLSPLALSAGTVSPTSSGVSGYFSPSSGSSAAPYGLWGGVVLVGAMAASGLVGASAGAVLGGGITTALVAENVE